MATTKSKISRVNHNSPVLESRTNRSRLMAAFLAVFFGGLGIHKFYLGKGGWGLAYIFFSWTFIPLILGVLEGFLYLLMSNQEFQKKYS